MQKLKIGDYVLISKALFHTSYEDKYLGCKGEIERISGKSIGVRLDGKINKNSSYGIFWFVAEELYQLKREQNINNQEECFMDKNHAVVKVKYLDEKISKREFDYAAYEQYNVGDYVAVNSGHHGFIIAKITAVENVTGEVQCGREVICKIDMTAYEERKIRAKRKAELKGKMEARIKEIQETKIYEMLAKEDESLAEMLKEFKEL